MKPCERQEYKFLVDALRACAKRKDLHKGGSIHADVVRRGLLSKDIFIGNALVDMYVKCGDLAIAEEVLDFLPLRDVISWTALIAGYAQHGHGRKGLHCYECMQSEGVLPNVVTFVCVLKACGSIGAAEKGEELHAKITREGFSEKNHILGTALVDMYAKCSALAKAQEVFDGLPVRDVVLWTAMIRGYAQHDHGAKALHLFEKMECDGFSPDAVTFACVLKACGSLGAAETGQRIHFHVIKKGLLEKDQAVGNALVDMYVKCGEIAKAQLVFEELPFRDAICWAALVVGCFEQRHSEEGLNYFEQMQQEGVSPTAAVVIVILKACGSIRVIEKGEKIHDMIKKENLLEIDSTIGNTLIDMYAECGALLKAQETFAELPFRDSVSWTTLIAGYCKHGHYDEALKRFDSMQYEGFSPDAITFLCILKACGCIGATEKGKEIYAMIVKEGLGNDIVLGIALVDMFAKCGAVGNAQQVFDDLPMQGVISWTALMAGYTQMGEHNNVLELYYKMTGEGVEPDLVTFTVLLQACNHGGLVDECRSLFEKMSMGYGIIPNVDLCTCMVDVFGRAGHFEKALAVIKKMPSSRYFSVWSALLSACQKWGNVELAKVAFDHAVQFDAKSAVAYVNLSNTYANAGPPKYSEEIEGMRKNQGAWKKPECYSSDAGWMLHPVSVGHKGHPQSGTFYSKSNEVAYKISQLDSLSDFHLTSQGCIDGANEYVL